MKLTRLFIVMLVALYTLTSQAHAQTSSNWKNPINLSQSGATSQPRFVVDTEGSGHLLWRDQFQGFIYSFNANLNEESSLWSDPAVVELPFSTRRFFPDLQPTAATPHFNPQLLADNSGRIHAFWLDNENRLYHSSVAAPELNDLNAWSNRRQLAESASALDATIAPNGSIHLAYVRPIIATRFPAGIYHRYLENTQDEWSVATLIYESLYLRGIGSQDAHVQITAASQRNNNYVYIGWDNRQLDQIFVARSINNGLTWETPYQVDNRWPNDGPTAVGPSQLTLQAQANNLLLTWQAGHEGRTCDQYYQWSDDAATTWSDPQAMSDQLSSCPSSLQLILDNTDNILLLARSDMQEPVLAAWDGNQWSDPQRQPMLSTFTNPDTFRPVEFGCYQVATTTNYLWVAGCDEGRSQDIWLLGRPLNTLEILFPPPPEEVVWQLPATLAEPTTAPTSLTVIGDTNGHFHTFWPDTSQSAITYTRWDGSQWSRPSPVLRNPAGGQVGQPAITQSNGRLLATWPDENNGELLFSWASIERATAASEWIAPRQLPIPPIEPPLVSDPAITADRQGFIYIAYAVPLNEGRGIYLTWSDDNGNSWSPPLNVFDGIEAGWVAVGPPQLAIDANNRLYASWMQVGREGQSQGLYLAVSDDSGISWSEATAVITGNVQWQQLLTIGEQTIHHLWAGPGGGTATTTQAALWHRFSTDSGQNWSRPTRIAGLGQNPIGPASVTLDAANQLHVVQLAGTDTDSDSPLSLYQWIWQDERWQTQPPLHLNNSLPHSFADPAAAAATNQQLGFAYLSLPSDNDNPIIAFSQRPINLPEVLPTPLPTLLPTATPTSLPTATPLPEPTPTLIFPTEAQSDRGLSLPLPDDRLASSLTGIIPALLLIIIAFIIGIYTLRRR